MVRTVWTSSVSRRPCDSPVPEGMATMATAPASMARKPRSAFSSSWVGLIMMIGVALRVMISLVVWNPSMPGMSVSMRTTLGDSICTMRTA
jgi:hypothetical protein